MRKLFISSAYFAFGSLFESISNFYYSSATRFDKIFVIANILGGISLFLMPSPYSLIILMSRVLPLLLFANAILMVYKSLKSYSSTLFFSWSFFGLTILHDTFALISHSGQRFLTVFSLPLAFSVFSYNMIVEYKDLLVKTRLAHARSITDSLTGAFNRGVLNELQLDPGDTVVFVDLNDLKYINDTYGHDEGDKVLKLLVSTIKSNIRSNDIVVRMGGDEFLIILKNCPQEKAKEIMEKISRQFKESHPLKPTIAYGIKAFLGNLTETIRTADSLMYQMKYQLKKHNNSQASEPSN
ncbi:GGDEF domain-containing protein [Pseudothermotoga thermarum]|uniref:GGDEF domain-containing protein n=1 Tax=Pseudothermotoga thermarum TaxID=119394 RepID=UPI00068E8386|nr:diguanylate cyclase [Pseudothermotoga thermarum]